MGQANDLANDPAVDELLHAADLLIRRRWNLAAIAVLHAEIRHRVMGHATGAATDYPSQRIARVEQRKIADAWRNQKAGQASSQLQGLLGGRPPWATQAAALVVFAALSLRYVHAVSDPSNWSRQHPEGNWISRFYTNDHLGGFPLVRYDIGVNADFGTGAPALSMSKDHFSAVWDTCLVVTKHTMLDLTLTSDDASKLMLDESAAIEIGPTAGQQTARISLREGLHHLRVEFKENLGTAMIRLDGLEWDGTDSYRFQRPEIEGTDVRCPR